MQTLTAQDAISVQDNQLVTTSLKVAEAFGKLHKDVLRKIQSIDCSEEFASAHFYAHEELIEAGAVTRRSKVYQMTKDGFMFLVMGFTGKKAAQIKEAYINAFNEMAQQLYGEPNFRLTPAQQRHIQKRVGELAHVPGNSFRSVYGSIKDQFQVGSYKDVPAEQYPKLCRFLNCEPLEGTLEPRAEEAPTPLDAQNVRTMAGHCEVIERLFLEQIGPAVRNLNPALYSQFREHVMVSSRLSRSLAGATSKERIGHG